MDGGVPRVVEAGVFDGGREVTCVGGASCVPEDLI